MKFQSHQRAFIAACIAALDSFSGIVIERHLNTYFIYEGIANTTNKNIANVIVNQGEGIVLSTTPLGQTRWLVETSAGQANLTYCGEGALKCTV